MTAHPLTIRDATGKEVTMRQTLGGFILRLPHKDGATSAYLEKEHAKALLNYLRKCLE